MKAKFLTKILEASPEEVSFVKSLGEFANSRGFDLVYDGDKDEFVLMRKGKELGRIKLEKNLVKVTVGRETEVFKGKGKELIDQVLKFISKKSLEV